jgi:MFS family permease
MKLGIPVLAQRKPAAEGAKAGNRPFFYGWYIVVAGFMGDMVNAGIGPYLLGVMLVPMQEALHTSRTMISLALTVRQLATALASPFVGPLVDKKDGAKWVMLGAGFLSGLGLVLTGLINAPWQFLLTYGLLGGLGALASGFMVTSILIAKWFVRMRGRATAIASMGISTGGIIMVPVGAVLADELGWRTVWVVVGVLIWSLIIPTALFIVKTRPEDMGLRPDGDPPQEETTRQESAQQATGPLVLGEVQWTRSEALRTPTLWLLILAFNLGGAEASGVVLHMKSYVQDQGLSSAMAAAAFSAYPWMALSGKPIWGFFIDKFSTQKMLISIYLFEAIGIALFFFITNVATAFLATMSFGLAVSGISAMQSVVWGNYYGRNFLGSIRGVVTPFQLLANAGGPVMAALVYDAVGSYTIPFSLFLAFALGAAFMALLAKPPRKGGAQGPAPLRNATRP